VSEHNGGDLQIQVTGEEHDHEALAKRVILTLLNLAGTAYRSPNVLEGTDGNAMMVALSDPTTGGPITVKNPTDLADGALSTTLTTLYTVPTTKKAWVTKMRFRNTGVSSRTLTVQFFSSSTGTARSIWPDVPLDPGESTDLIAGEDLLGLATGNIIKASQDAGADIDYVISGEELS
jgi:hypothetical protein